MQSPSPTADFSSKLRTSKTMSGCVAQGLIVGEVDHYFLSIDQIFCLGNFLIFKLKKYNTVLSLNKCTIIYNSII